MSRTFGIKDYFTFFLPRLLFVLHRNHPCFYSYPKPIYICSCYRVDAIYIKSLLHQDLHSNMCFLPCYTCEDCEEGNRRPIPKYRHGTRCSLNNSRQPLESCPNYTEPLTPKACDYHTQLEKEKRWAAQGEAQAAKNREKAAKAEARAAKAKAEAETRAAKAKAKAAKLEAKRAAGGPQYGKYETPLLLPGQQEFGAEYVQRPEFGA